MKLISRVNSQDGNYRTEPKSSAPLLPTLSFYLKAGPIVWNASKIARRGEWWYENFHKESSRVADALEAVGCKFEVTGLKPVMELKRPCVFVGNHMSTLETFILPVFLLPIMPTTFVIKQQLMDYPVFGHIIRDSNAITVTRKDPRQDLKDVMEQGVNKLKNEKTSVIVFPQTTRTRTFDKTHFNSIGVKLAKRAGVPVVPMALKTDAWGIGWPIKDIGIIHPEHKIRFAFGEPMEIEGNGRDQQAKVVEFITESFSRWEKEPS
jgi:1-acyl-sn-glycerol-3-phosphate acyltransferase